MTATSETTETTPDSPIQIGISSCLLGQKVRFDGQHKRHWYINEVLGNYFTYVPICPEVEVGMGIPRQTIRLVGDVDNPDLIEPKTGKNWTKSMASYSSKKVKNLTNLDGYLFKKGSPSCGLFRVKVYQIKSGIPLSTGQGLYAKKFQELFPLVPCEDEGRLSDPVLRENFIERVFCHHRLRQLLEKRFARKNWIQFHQQSKFLLLAHGRKNYSILGQLVAAIADYTPKEFMAEYANLYMTALAVKTTAKKQMDVLQHILGFLKKFLTSQQKSHILATIEDYGRGITPLIVPLTLLKHYIDIFQVEYIRDQFYLNPHPHNLSLRNHV